MGVIVSDTTPEISTAMPTVTANSRNSRPTIPSMNRIGRNTAESETVIVTTVKPISFAPSSAACMPVLAHLHVARDVLQHHDGVVDDETRPPG